MKSKELSTPIEVEHKHVKEVGSKRRYFVIIKITINRIDWEVFFTSSDNALLIDNNGVTAYEECNDIYA